MGSEHPNIVPYGKIFPTEDGRQFVVAVGTERQFAQFAAALGLPELIEDQRFASNAARVRNRAVLNEILKNRIKDIEAEKLSEALTVCKVPFGFVNDMAEVFEQSASRAQCFDGGRGVRTVALEGDIEGARSLPAPPRLDQHRSQILRWLDSLEPDSA
jgi:crotonobetainyl-CoA:carnitine CoA-transferase CaiB-like acyl-CoA transferase